MGNRGDVTAQDLHPPPSPARDGSPPSSSPAGQPPQRPWRTEGLPKSEPPKPRRRWITLAVWLLGYLLFFGLLTVQDRTPAEILATDIEATLAPFDLRNQLSSNRTQGIPNMIALIRATAERYA